MQKPVGDSGPRPPGRPLRPACAGHGLPFSLNITPALTTKTPHSSPLAIEVRGLRKSYGSVEAVRGIDLQVSTGEVFALLGPNGAGKTTTIEILEGYLDRTAGDVSVLGYDPSGNHRSLKERIGIVLQSTGVQPYLNVEETVNLFRGYYPNPLPLEEVLSVTGLTELRGIRARRLSTGQQRRLDVAIGLSGNPDLLFLDEPTTGFDPSARRGAWDMIRNLRNLGKTVVLTTHYMDEAEHLADRVAIMVHGEIVAQGTPSELLRNNGATTIRFKLAAEARPPPEDLAVGPMEPNGQYTAVTFTPTSTLHRLTGWALEQGLELEEMSVSRPSLEDLFVQLAESPETDDTQQ